jgi:hypothetical protein
MIRRFVWDKAESDLSDVDPAVVAQLKKSAEQILHNIPPWLHPFDEGVSNGIMWHRARVHQESDGPPDGPQNYFVFYKNGSDHVFEILGVCSVHQIASRWAALMNKQSRSLYDE